MCPLPIPDEPVDPRAVALRPIMPTDGEALRVIFTEAGVRRYLFDDILLSRAETEEHVEAAVAYGAWTCQPDM
jgi:hypothetical protein